MGGRHGQASGAWRHHHGICRRLARLAADPAAAPAAPGAWRLPRPCSQQPALSRRHRTSAVIRRNGPKRPGRRQPASSSRALGQAPVQASHLPAPEPCWQFPLGNPTARSGRGPPSVAAAPPAAPSRCRRVTRMPRQQPGSVPHALSSRWLSRTPLCPLLPVASSGGTPASSPTPAPAVCSTLLQSTIACLYIGQKGAAAIFPCLVPRAPAGAEAPLEQARALSQRV